jgi:Tol biopolymer transport system component
MRRLTTLAGFCGILIALALPAGGGATVPGPNGLIVFRAVTGDGSSQIFTIAPDGSGQRQITHLDGDAFSPHWSPQSNRIVFEFDPANVVGNDFCHIVTMNRNGGGLRILPLANGDQCENFPTFSADGHRIFYGGFDGVSREAIFSMKLNGNDRRFVSDCQGTGVTDPEVSPDGTMISFTCFSEEGQALFDANIDGSGLHQLTPFSAQVGVKADWSPDSQRIMFITAVDEGEPDAQVNTWTIARDGSDLEAVTSYAPGGTRAFGNSYSPDGQWILLRIEQDDLNALFKIRPDGTDLTQITPFSSFRPRNMAWGSALAGTFAQGD